MDGSLLPFESKSLLNGETYFTRKVFYAVNMLVVCDHKSRITYYVVVWTVSVHDNRTCRSSKIKQCSRDYFLDIEYLITDSSYSSSEHTVPAFKCSSGKSLSQNRSTFNDLLTRPGVKSEHCIRMLKGRFPWMKNICIKIVKKDSLKRVCEYVQVCVILHYLLFDVQYDLKWIEQEITEDDELNQSISTILEAPKDNRRKQHLCYLGELTETQFY